MAPSRLPVKERGHWPQSIKGLWAVAALLCLACLGGRLIDALILLVLILSHEAAHLAVASGCGCKPIGLRFTPLGGELSLTSEFSLMPGSEALIALAGPLHHFVVLGLASLAEPFPQALGAHWPFFVRANLSLACFNLLPIYPLDGGRVLHAALRAAKGIIEAERLQKQLNRYLALGLCGAGLLLLHAGFGPWLAVSGLYLLLTAHTPRQLSPLPTYLRLQARKRSILEHAGAAKLDLVAVDAASPIWPLLQKHTSGRYGVYCVLSKTGMIAAWVTEEEALQALSRNGLGAKFEALCAREPRGRSCPGIVE